MSVPRLLIGEVTMSRIGVSGSTEVSRLSESTRRLRAFASLSDRELLSRVEDLVSRERAVTLEVLVHLIEVERRRLHLGLGYASMFDYCTKHLGYSSSAASRRIQSARCVRDYAEVYALLEKNEVNLVTISLVASILTESNAKDLIAKIRGKSQREVEEIVAAYRPPVSMRDRAKPVCVAVTEPVARTVVNSGQSCPIPPTAGSEKRPIAAGGSAAGQSQAPTIIQAQSQAGTQPSDVHPTPRLERKFQVQFLASERFMKKFERARALLSNKNGAPSYEFVLEAALDEFLKDHDPEQRKQRREERNEKAEAIPRSGERVARRNVRSQSVRRICGAGWGQVDDPLFRRWVGDLPPTRVLAEGASRHIPTRTRDAVFARDKGRCTYVGSTGKRCDATHNLQIDHIVPFARGGTSTRDNLRLLCERHNKLEAERILGTLTVRRFRRRE
jgi:5-methylcytosine-specific restriction endonuclease McrA